VYILYTSWKRQPSLCVPCGWFFGWLRFNGTFSTNRPYRAIGKVNVC